MNILEKDPANIPFIFRNKELTIPANPELKEWLLAMIEHYPESLRFLHAESQLYIKHGGANTYDWARWIKKLEKDCNKVKEF